MPWASQNLAQPSQVALRGYQGSGRTGDRLDEDRGDGAAAIGFAVTLQVVGEFGPGLALAPRERRDVCRMVTTFGMTAPKVSRFRTMPASDVPPMLTPWYARSRETKRRPWPSPRAMIGHDHLQGGVDRLDPELVKKTWLKGSGRMLTSFWASAKLVG